MKVEELDGDLLDYWVARAEGLTEKVGTAYKPSTDWAIGGPIIERECMMINPIQALIRRNFLSEWSARIEGKDGRLTKKSTGPTLLIAAMRAYVVSRFGEDVPE